jgi:hypothetical protein
MTPAALVTLQEDADDLQTLAELERLHRDRSKVGLEPPARGLATSLDPEAA